MGSNGSPEMTGKGETSDILGLPLGQESTAYKTTNFVKIDRSPVFKQHNLFSIPWVPKAETTLPCNDNIVASNGGG